MTRLGKGLSALIKNEEIDHSVQGSVNSVKIELIQPNRYQPRKVFDLEKLQDLAQSITENGVIQPIIITQLDDNKYELIAGERRLEASKLAGLTEIPAVIREATPREKLIFAIIENVQREDLSPLEEAKAYHQLIEEFELTHSDISTIMGKDRATVSNTLRLLKLPQVVQDMIDRKEITSGHARAILQVSVELQEEFAEFIIKNHLSVRKAEEAVNRYSKSKPVHIAQKPIYENEELYSIEANLKKHFGKNVKIKPKAKESGELIITFKSRKELEEIINSFMSNM